MSTWNLIKVYGRAKCWAGPTVAALSRCRKVISGVQAISQKKRAVPWEVCVLQGQRQLEKGVQDFDFRCLSFTSTPLFALSFNPDQGNERLVPRWQQGPFSGLVPWADVHLEPCSTHSHSPGSFGHATCTFLPFYCRIWLTQSWGVGRSVGVAARGGSVTLGGKELVKAGSGCFGNLALVSDGPPVVCVPCLTERRLSRCYSNSLLGVFLIQERSGSCEQEQRGVWKSARGGSVFSGWSWNFQHLTAGLWVRGVAGAWVLVLSAHWRCQAPRWDVLRHWQCPHTRGLDFIMVQDSVPITYSQRWAVATTKQPLPNRTGIAVRSMVRGWIFSRNPWKAEELHQELLLGWQPWVSLAAGSEVVSPGKERTDTCWFKRRWELSCPWFAWCGSGSHLNHRSALVLKWQRRAVTGETSLKSWCVPGVSCPGARSERWGFAIMVCWAAWLGYEGMSWVQLHCF